MPHKMKPEPIKPSNEDGGTMPKSDQDTGKTTTKAAREVASSVRKSSATGEFVAVDVASRKGVATGRTSEATWAKAGQADAAIDYRDGRRSS